MIRLQALRTAELLRTGDLEVMESQSPTPGICPPEESNQFRAPILTSFLSTLLTYGHAVGTPKVREHPEHPVRSEGY